MLWIDIVLGFLLLGLLVWASPFLLGISALGLIISVATWEPWGILVSIIGCLLSGGLMKLRESDTVYVIVKR
ncbi:hypothetical protein ABT403_32015 [Streptomyces sp. NPDC000075]|uniref:hypothetical protein n=1 Tax=Streptomyces TaxID=1883 RepID=UPI0031DDD87A